MNQAMKHVWLLLIICFDEILGTLIYDYVYDVMFDYVT